jgi:two-component system OmpR family response regulator
MTNVKVLIVDDEREFSDVLAERMESRGFQVDIVESGAEALRKVGKRTYDAIVLDLAMPKMDGIETLRRLLEANEDLQIIILTGHATMEKGIEAVKQGAAEFLEKPADLDLLVEKIKAAQSKKFLLFEKRMEDAVTEIMKKKGW